jgi:hypothetical protein
MDTFDLTSTTILAAALPTSDQPLWLQILVWVGFGSAFLYHVGWLLGRCIKNFPSLWKFVVLFFFFVNHQEAGELVRRALRIRLSTTLLSTSAQWLNLFRLGLIGAVIWRWIRMRALDPPWVPDLLRPFGDLASIVLMCATFCYAIFIYFARRYAERSQVLVGEKERRISKSGPPGLWSQHYPDVFFYPAIVDAFYVIFAMLCLPGPGDVHLGLFVPVVAAWLFNNAGRTLILYLFIVLALAIDWSWTSWLMTAGTTQGTIGYSWTHTFWGSVFPRMVFWFLVCCLMMVMRMLRRMAEEQAAFFRGLAEALPFEVFVKEKEKKDEMRENVFRSLFRGLAKAINLELPVKEKTENEEEDAFRFVFATDKLVNKLRCIPKNEKLDLSSIQGKTDVDLHIQQEKAAYYRSVDQRVMAGEEYHEFEPTYAHNSNAEIETLKRPIRNREGKPAYVLGLCRDPLTETDPWYFLFLIGKQLSFCFFRKRCDGRFLWANDKFAQDAGKTSSLGIKGMTDWELYERRDAEKYTTDDVRVIHTNQQLEEEEWHQPLGGAKRRVRVTKMRVDGPDGNADGVRGYFYDIHRSYILRVSVDSVVTQYFNRLLEGLELWSQRRDERGDDFLPDEEVEARAYEISRRPGWRAQPDAAADWYEARAELRKEHRERYRLLGSARPEDLLYGCRLLANAIRLLSLREHELTRIAERRRDSVPECYVDLMWTQKKSNLPQLLDRLRRVFCFLFPSVEFSISHAESTNEWEVDPRWLEVMVAGLWFYTAELAAHPDVPKISTAIHTEATSEKRDGEAVLILSIKHAHRNSSRLPADIKSASEFLTHGDGRSCMGLLLARRANVLSGGSITCRSGEGEPPVRIFELRLSKH